MSIPQDLFYTKTHEWVKIEDNKAKVGITFYLQTYLGEVNFVELPSIGKKIKQFEKIAIIEAMKAVMDIHSPLSGEVIEVNERLKNNPQLINQSPYQEGWLLILKIEDLKEKENLLNFKDYQKFLETAG